MSIPIVLDLVEITVSDKPNEPQYALRNIDRNIKKLIWSPVVIITVTFAPKGQLLPSSMCFNDFISLKKYVIKSDSITMELQPKKIDEICELEFGWQPEGKLNSEPIQVKIYESDKLKFNSIFSSESEYYASQDEVEKFIEVFQKEFFGSQPSSLIMFHIKGVPFSGKTKFIRAWERLLTSSNLSNDYHLIGLTFQEVKWITDKRRSKYEDQDVVEIAKHLDEQLLTVLGKDDLSDYPATSRTSLEYLRLCLEPRNKKNDEPLSCIFVIDSQKEWNSDAIALIITLIKERFDVIKKIIRHAKFAIVFTDWHTPVYPQDGFTKIIPHEIIFADINSIQNLIEDLIPDIKTKPETGSFWARKILEATHGHWRLVTILVEALLKNWLKDQALVINQPQNFFKFETWIKDEELINNFIKAALDIIKLSMKNSKINADTIDIILRGKDMDSISDEIIEELKKTGLLIRKQHIVYEITSNNKNILQRLLQGEG